MAIPTNSYRPSEISKENHPIKPSRHQISMTLKTKKTHNLSDIRQKKNTTMIVVVIIIINNNNINITHHQIEANQKKDTFTSNSGKKMPTSSPLTPSPVVPPLISWFKKTIVTIDFIYYKHP